MSTETKCPHCGAIQIFESQANYNCGTSVKHQNQRGSFCLRNEIQDLRQQLAEEKTKREVVEKEINYAKEFLKDCACGAETIMGGIQMLRRFGNQYANDLRTRLEAAEAERNIVKEQCRELHDQIGYLPEGAHPDERNPRAATWLQERENWESEVDRLRQEISRQGQAIIRLEGEKQSMRESWRKAIGREQTLTNLLRRAKEFVLNSAAKDCVPSCETRECRHDRAKELQTEITAALEGKPPARDAEASKCHHTNGVFFSVDNYYCRDCKKGMGQAYYKVATLLKRAGKMIGNFQEDDCCDCPTEPETVGHFCRACRAAQLQTEIAAVIGKEGE